MNHVIVNGYNLAFRSHYAFMELKTTTGFLSGCFYGTMVGMRAIKKRFPDCHITVAWDREAVRKKALYAKYKADRSEIIFFSQIKDLKKVFYRLNISQSEHEGEEADDVIASLVKRYKTEDNQIYIYSNDKDMLQLVKDGHVIVVKPKWGKHPEKVFDEEAVIEKFGVAPNKFADFQCFRGDGIDNIPGVPSVRSTVIARLINKYETPQNVYANLEGEELTDYERKAFGLCESQVILNLKLVKLREDLDLKVIDGKGDPDLVQTFLDKYQIKSLNSNTFVGLFRDVTMNFKKAPAVESYSLFD